MDSEKEKSIEKRLRKVETRCEDISDIKKSVNRIEQELVGDEFGNRPSFRSRLETVEENQSKTVKVSTGGAGVITIAINAVKEFIF